MTAAPKPPPREPRPPKPIKRKKWLERSRKPIPQINPVARAKREKAYKAALRSAHAKAQRKMLVLRCNGICETCGKPFTESDPMERGHLTYARLGRELDSDVVGEHKSCNRRERAFRKPYQRIR